MGVENLPVVNTMFYMLIFMQSCSNEEQKKTKNMDPETGEKSR
jgi:hypothetical protein